MRGKRIKTPLLHVENHRFLFRSKKGCAVCLAFDTLNRNSSGKVPSVREGIIPAPADDYICVQAIHSLPKQAPVSDVPTKIKLYFRFSGVIR